MKRNKLIILSALIATLVGFNACQEDFLELEPSFATSTDDAFTTIDKANAVLVGAYDIMSDYRGYGLYLQLVPEVMGEDLYIKASGNYNWFVHDYRYNTLPNYARVEEIWFYVYQAIQAANQIITQVPNITGDETRKAELIGQAKGLRAMCYLSLVRLYSTAYSVNPDAPGVPLRVTPATADSEDPPRGTVREVYTQIIADATEAANEAPVTGGPSFFTQAAGHAIAARAYLDMEDWTNARDHAKAAYANNDLMSATEMLAGFADPNSEWILSMQYSSDDYLGYLFVHSFYDNRILGYSSVRADVDFLALYDIENDIRADWFENDGTSYVLNQDGGKMEKYLHRSDWDMDEVLIRSSEMYLIEAEAEAQLGNDPEAQNALFAIQVRANPDAVKSTATGQTLLEEIYLERRKELVGEGHRLFDIKRLQQPLQRGASAWPEVIKSLPANDPLFNYPIPQDEIDANDNISEADQNDAY